MATGATGLTRFYTRADARGSSDARRRDTASERAPAGGVPPPAASEAMEMSRDPRDIVLQPIVSEKSYAAYDQGVYTFLVASDANKIEIKQAVESIFNVKVKNVNTMNRKGKRKRNRRTGTFGNRAAQKRAVVTLAGDDKIEIFGS
jgi:large subunit ribosomal protein L23